MLSMLLGMSPISGVLRQRSCASRRDAQVNELMRLNVSSTALKALHLTIPFLKKILTPRREMYSPTTTVRMSRIVELQGATTSWWINAGNRAQVEQT